MAAWDVVNQAPAPEFEDRWAPVAEEVAQDPWKPVEQTPVKPQGRGILQALKDYPAHFVSTLLETPQRAFEASEVMRTTGELSPEGAGDIMGGALLGGVKFAKKVGGARAHPTDAVEWKPVSETPISVEPVLEAQAARQMLLNDDVALKTEANKRGLSLEDTRVKIQDEYAASNATPIVEEPALAHPEPTSQQMSSAKSAARVIQNILIPDEVSPMAESAAADIRSAGGRAARDTETTRAALDAESRKVAALPDAEKLGLIDYIENRSKPTESKYIGAHGGEMMPDQVRNAMLGNKQQLMNIEHTVKDPLDRARDPGKIAHLESQIPSLKSEIAKQEAFLGNKGAVSVRPDLKPVADAVKTAMDKRRAKLEALDSTEKIRFVEDYYTHLWKDPEAAARVFSGPSKEGSGRFLKERSIPTVAEGIARGLEPVSINPLEVTLQYAQNMDRFIASSEVIDKALKDGNAKHYTPGEQPPGWVEINTRRGKGPLYAPEDWARVYNNFVDRGIHRNADWGKIYDGARNTSNAITSLELGLSGFHAATMAQEAMVNAVARGIGEIASGKPVSALKSLVKAPIAPIADTLRGRKLEQTYLNKSKGTPLMQEITDLLTEAGGRGKGARHAPDYQYSQAGSYWDSFKRGSVMAEIKAAGRDIRERPLAAPIKLLASQVGRVLQTVAKPLFEYTIPKMKNGAFYENMASWMEANPAADHATQVKAARKIWNSIDNRFGEVVQDNIFWNKTLKQSLQVALRSYSWTFGTIQEIGGGAKDLLRHPTSLSPKSKHYSPKAAYIIALPITYATLNAVYQKLKTGKDPESISDVMRGGLSGGTQPGVGGRGTVPERTMMPGYMKDVFGWYYHPVQELKNKVATGPRMVVESLTNKDWKDQPIRNPNAPYPEQVREYFKYVYQSLGPISVKQLLKGNKEGSNISTGETLLGLRPTPSFLQDPEGYDKMKKGISERDWQKKERYDKRQQRQYGGP